jgi:hypothetical protein
LPPRAGLDARIAAERAAFVRAKPLTPTCSHPMCVNADDVAVRRLFCVERRDGSIAAM